MKTIHLESFRKVDIDGNLFSINHLQVVEGKPVNEVIIKDSFGLTVDPKDSVYKKIKEVYL